MTPSRIDRSAAIRPRSAAPLLVVLSLVFATLAPAAIASSSDQVVVSVIDRDAPYRGRLIKVDAQGTLHLMVDAGEAVQIAGRRVVTVTFPSASTTRGPVRLDLVGGDVLYGLIEDENDDGLVLAGTSVPRITVPIEQLVRLEFPGASTGLEDLPPFVAAGEKDVVFRRGRDKVDRVVGTVDAIGPRGVVLETSIGEVPFKLADVVAIAFGAPAEIEPIDGLSAIVVGADGSRMTGRLVGSDDRSVTLATRHGFTVALASRHIRTIYFRGGDLDFLSDLKPTDVVERSYWPGMVWRMRRDETTEGRPLTIGGVAYPKGLGVHAYSSITYDLGGRYKAFRTLVGIDDEVRTMKSKGAVVFTVAVDGKEVYRSALVRGLAAATRVPSIDVTGARKLTITVEFGDDSHAGDRADWAMALLVKA